MRLIFLGIGLGVLTGSTLRTIALQQTINPFSFTQWFSSKKKENLQDNLKNIFGFPSNQQELTKLSLKWEALAKKQPDLKVSGFLLLLDKQQYAKINSNIVLPAASSIKTPILLAALIMLDEGQLSWNEPLKLSKDVIGGGAGWMAYQPLGKSFPTYEVATEMIRISDNTATNLLIKRMGGIQIVNERFLALGLKSTTLNNFLPDLKGSNTTNAKDLAHTFALVDKGKVLTPRSRDLFREIMSTSTTDRLIPGGLLKGLGVSTGEPNYNLQLKGYRVYNKTGDIGISYADAALIQLPDGSRAVAGFIVKGPFNDPRSTELIRNMAAATATVLQPNEAKTQSNE